MDKNYLLIAGVSIKEYELRLLGELLVASYNAHTSERMSEQVNPDSSPLEKHSACLKKSEALKYEAEIYRLLSCLYESTADRSNISSFIDEVVDLINK